MLIPSLWSRLGKSLWAFKIMHFVIILRHKPLCLRWWHSHSIIGLLNVLLLQLTLDKTKLPWNQGCMDYVAMRIPINQSRGWWLIIIRIVIKINLRPRGIFVTTKIQAQFRRVIFLDTILDRHILHLNVFLSIYQGLIRKMFLFSLTVARRMLKILRWVLSLFRQWEIKRGITQKGGIVC